MPGRSAAGRRALTRAAERAERTGAPARAAASYATAAELTRPDRRTGRRRRRVVGTRRGGRRRQRRLGRGDRAGRPCRRISISSAARPGRRPAPRRSPGRRCTGGADTPRRAISSPPPWRCCGQILAPTPCAPWSNWRRWRCSPAHRTRTASAPRRWPSARPSAVDRPARRPVHHPRDLPWHDRTAPRSGRLLPRGRPARHAGRRQRGPGTCTAQPVRHTDRRPTPRPARRPPAPPPGICAGPAPGTCWLCGREPGPRAAAARRLGHRR